MTTKLLKPVLSVEKHHFPALLVTIPSGATVQYEASAVGFGLVDVEWDGKTYCASVRDLLSSSSVRDR